jgi:hypothetical protein
LEIEEGLEVGLELAGAESTAQFGFELEVLLGLDAAR